MLGVVLLVSAGLAAGLVLVAWRSGNALAAALAAILIAVNLVAADRALRVTRLTLRGDGTARLSVRGLRGWRHRDFPRHALRAAVEHQRGPGGTSARVMLLVGAGPPERVPLTGYFATAARARDRVADVEAWRHATGAT